MSDKSFHTKKYSLESIYIPTPPHDLLARKFDTKRYPSKTNESAEAEVNQVSDTPIAVKVPHTGLIKVL